VINSVVFLVAPWHGISHVHSRMLKSFEKRNLSLNRKARRFDNLFKSMLFYPISMMYRDQQKGVGMTLGQGITNGNI